jgi:hypothetical protein
LIAERCGGLGTDWVTRFSRHLSPRLINLLGQRLLGIGWFAREVVLNRWFLHAGEAAFLESVAEPRP